MAGMELTCFCIENQRWLWGVYGVSMSSSIPASMNLPLSLYLTPMPNTERQVG